MIFNSQSHPGIDIFLLEGCEQGKLYDSTCIWCLLFSFCFTVLNFEMFMCFKLVFISNYLLSTICFTKFSQFICLSVQFRSVAQSCPTLCNPMNHSTTGLPVYHQLPEFTQTHVHRVGDAIQPSHPLSSPFPPAPNPSQHQGLFQWVNSSRELAKVLEFQL